MATVLVVDDDPDILLLVRMLLERAGHIVLAGATGPAAVEGARDPVVDLIVLDLTLPGLTGTEALAELRAFSAVPVLLLTAHAGERHEESARRAGADDFLEKPFGADDFLARVESLLAGAREREGVRERAGDPAA